MPVAETCYVKIYDVAGDDVPDSAEARPPRRPRLPDLPDVFPANFHELEYFVPFERAPTRSRRCGS